MWLLKFLIYLNLSLNVFLIALIISKGFEYVSLVRIIDLKDSLNLFRVRLLDDVCDFVFALNHKDFINLLLE
jgi:hypothetical protein